MTLPKRPSVDGPVHRLRVSRLPARRERGFTALEVLISMAIMFMGAAAVMTMQKTSIQANLDARKADVAGSIARTWVERIRHESVRWTQPTSTNPTSNLSGVPGLASHIGGGWFRPTQDMIASQTPAGSVETMSYGFDILGRDLAAADIPTNAAFCVEVQLTELLPNYAYRVDVRVVWPREIVSVPNAAGATPLSSNGNNWPCVDAVHTFPPYATFDYTLFRAVNVTTAITENPAQ
jgi:type II secretory pathway pseudopilin PulG